MLSLFRPSFEEFREGWILKKIFCQDRINLIFSVGWFNLHIVTILQDKTRVEYKKSAATSPPVKVPTAISSMIG